MKIMSAREAKNAFGLMIDTTRGGPMLIVKHGLGIVVLVAVEEYERLTGKPAADRRGPRTRRRVECTF